MKTLLLLLVFGFGSSAYAKGACYSSEKNVSTKKMFTENDWEEALADWDSKEPADPGILKLFAAYQVYQKELPTANTFKGDKRKHCYIGCRIAQDVSHDTAVYTAWYKEKEDLTDCVKGSYFELRDYEITVQGADLGLKNKDPKYCLEECSLVKRY